MPDLYFTCDWVIRPAVNYARLEGIAHETGCELAVIQANIVTPERLVLMRFVLHAPAQAAFDAFVDKVGASIGLEDWRPADAATFEQAQPLDLHLLDADFLSRWMDAMHAYGLHNQSVLQAQGQQEQQEQEGNRADD